MTITLDETTLDSALALLLAPHEWRHRRVDSVHLETGERGRWKASIDCTPSKDDVIPYGTGHVVLPLALVKKGPMRDLNVTDASGDPLPVLTSSENTRLARAVLLRALANGGVPQTAFVEEAAEKIVGSRGDSDEVDALLETGYMGGRQVFDRMALEKIGPAARVLMLDLARNFILGVVVRNDILGRRQLMKFSYFWHVDILEESGWKRIILGSFGFKELELAVDVPMAGDAASFHLEFHPPEGLTCRLRLPPMDFVAGRGYSDADPTQVAHAYGAYEPAEPSLLNPAEAELFVSRRGPWLMTLLLAAFTFLFFLFGIWFDGALGVLRGEESGDGVDPSALLLTLPGVIVGLLVSAREHMLATYLLMPIRTAAVTCSALLLIASASLTFQLQDPHLVRLWFLSLTISAAILGALIFGAVVRARRTRGHNLGLLLGLKGRNHHAQRRT